MRQPLLFLVIGGLQYLCDAALFALFITLGAGTLPANVASRASAAGMGFVMNRYLTFGQRNDTLERFGRSLARFVLLFAVLTLVSTVAILALEALWGPDRQSRILAKLVVEAVLAVTSFLASRYWVYRS